MWRMHIEHLFVTNDGAHSVTSVGCSLYTQTSPIVHVPSPEMLGEREILFLADFWTRRCDPPTCSITLA